MQNFKIQLFSVISLFNLDIKIKNLMTEINRKNVVLFFQITHIQLFSIIFVLLCLNDSGEFDKINDSFSPPAGSLVESDGKKYL